MKFIKVKRENDYGELIDIAYSKNGKFVIYPFLKGFDYTTVENFKQKIVDPQYVIRFSPRYGFTDIDKVIHYAERFL